MPINGNWKGAEEELFRKFCNRSMYPYMHIDQERKTFAHKIFEEESKRPDYMVSIPDVGSVFFDVKTKPKRHFYEDLYGISMHAFTVDISDFKKLKRLQELTSTKVWYAYFEERKKELNKTECFTIPLTRVESFWLDVHNDPRWKYIQVPTDCYNQSTSIIDLENKCLSCKKKTCVDLKERFK